MAIDGCKHRFDTLARTILPGHMLRLRRALLATIPAQQFLQPRVGVKKLAAQLGKQGDCRGCYVFLSGRRPFYVGISKKVIERIRQHLRGRSHFEATLAYRIAQRGTRHKQTRAANMRSKSFMRRFEQARKQLANAEVAFVEVENPLELYLLEVYAAMKLGTGRWNSFDTH